jgi:hypothetical protein
VIGQLVLKTDKIMASSNTASYIGRHQYSVAYPGGVEAPVHVVCELHDSNELWALVLLDWHNAFNSIDRVHTAHCIAACAPSLMCLYEWSYHKDLLLILLLLFPLAGLIASILLQARVHQGDVLRPLFFSIGVAHILDTLADLPRGHLWAYLDDILYTVL